MQCYENVPLQLNTEQLWAFCLAFCTLTDTADTVQPSPTCSALSCGEMVTPGVPQLKSETQWEWKLKPSIFEMTASPVAA